MENFESNNNNAISHNEQKETLKFGNNIDLVVDLIRHAEKESVEGGLSQKGKEWAYTYGENIKTEFQDSAGVKIYYSPAKRTTQTAEEIKKGAETKYIPRERKSLTLDGRISDDFGNKLVEIINQNKGDESEAIQIMIDTGDKRIDEQSLSSKEYSKDLAKQLLLFVEMTKKFRDESKVNIVLVSHSGIIEHLLVDVLHMNRENFIKEIGGPVKFLEGARFEIKRENKENMEILFEFREHKYPISEEDLLNLGR